MSESCPSQSHVRVRVIRVICIADQNDAKYWSHPLSLYIYIFKKYEYWMTCQVDFKSRKERESYVCACVRVCARVKKQKPYGHPSHLSRSSHPSRSHRGADQNDAKYPSHVLYIYIYIYIYTYIYIYIIVNIRRCVKSFLSHGRVTVRVIRVTLGISESSESSVEAVLARERE